MNAAELEAVLDALAARAADLRDYRRDTLGRLVAARVASLGLGDADYLRLLRDDPDEPALLARALLVHVTGFFRDAAVFEALGRVVVPVLARRGPPRALVVGAATGEEAWSVAALLEHVAPGRWEVLGTDRDPARLAEAERGVYPSEALRDAPPALRAAFEDDGARARPAERLRRRVRFAAHDLMGLRAAPPEAIVASFGLVLCRNVLVYFDDRFRAQALARLRALVEPGGALVLGAAEGLPLDEPAFAPFPGVAPGLGIHLRRPG